MSKRHRSRMELTFPDHMPAEVRESIKTGLGRWEEDQARRENLEAAYRLNEKEIEQIGKAVTEIAEKFGLTEALGTLVKLQNIRAERVETALSELYDQGNAISQE